MLRQENSLLKIIPLLYYVRTMSIPVEQLKALFSDALLCPDDTKWIEEDGYLSYCRIQFLLSLGIVAWACYMVGQISNFTTDGPVKQPRQHLKFALMMIYVVTIILNGPNVFNALSTTVSLLSMLFAFVLSYMEFNGVEIGAGLEPYFLLVTAAMGYSMLKRTADEDFFNIDDVKSTLFVCVCGGLNAWVRNLVRTYENALKQKK